MVARPVPSESSSVIGNTARPRSPRLRTVSLLVGSIARRMRLIGAAGPYPVFAPVRRSTISCRCRCRYRAGQSVQLRNKSSSSSSSSSTVDSSSKAPASLASPRETTAAAENPPASTPSSAYQQVSTSASASSSGALNASTPRPLIQTIKLATIDKIAKAYGRAQDRRPYLTQVLSTLVVYLCGDLTAQLLLAGDNNEAQEAQAGEEEEKHAASTSTRYDPLRTIRHLSVGAVAALPVYKWCDIPTPLFCLLLRRED